MGHPAALQETPQTRVSREERVQQVLALRDEGLTHRQIGERLGLSKSTINNYFVDPDGTKAKTRKARYGGTCNECGGPTDGGNGREQAPDRCMWCVRGIPMNDRRRPHQPSLRRCVPILFADIPLEVRMQAAMDANKHERIRSEKERNMAAAIWPDPTTIYWVAEGGLEVLAEYTAAVNTRMAA